ncbi:hypothetical protein [Antarctobacter jejuensis]|uniref:hypothetical protein n=1 Tax=Antarctobacter jejuensis TaxID=1439938 RepID=UPI003FD48FEB
MAVIENTDSVFEASIRSRLAGIILLVLGLVFSALGVAALAEGEAQGGIFVAIGIGMSGLAIWLLSRCTRIRLDRSDNSARITFSSVLGQRRVDLPLNAISHASVLKTRRSGKRLYQLVLNVPAGEHAGTYSLTGGYSSGGWPKGRMARAINRWLGVEET